MHITPIGLTRFAAAAAVAAGLIFIGVQVGHPPLDAETITTTEMAIRSALKALMAALALVGITGMYLRQVEETGLLGLVGYLLFAAGYLLMLGTQFPSAFVLPTIADTNPGYVNDVIAVALAATPDGDIGPLATVMSLQGVGYLTGALLFGIALYRARVLVRWASALLALSGLLTAALSVMPDALYRFLAWPNGIALVALGYSLWRTTRTSTTPSQTTPTPRATTAGGPVTLDTDQTAARGTRAGPGRPGPAGTPSLGEPVALVLLSLIPVTAGVLRIIEILGGPQLFSENPRVDASPAPVALHLAAAATYALGGAFQFSARLRRRHPGWHRTTGRVLHERLDVVVEHSGSRL